MGPGVSDARKKITRPFRCMAHTLQRLNDELAALMPAGVRRVAGEVRMASLWYATVLLAWSDPACIQGIIGGPNPLLGTLDRQPDFRSAASKSPVASREELLASSEEWIDSLEAAMGPSGDPAKDLAMQDQTEKEMGVASSVPRTRHEMDARWGKGAWRPHCRFVIFQHHSQK